MKISQRFLLALMVFSATATSVASGPLFTIEQAARGQSLYQTQCASCHGLELGGGEAAPALAGDAFRQRWQGRPLVEFTAANLAMPLSNPGGLSGATYSAIMAFVLYQNGFPTGEVALKTSSTSDSNLNQFGQSVSQPLDSPAVAAGTMQEWLHHRGSAHGTNYSPLDLINADNVEALDVVWRWRSDNYGAALWPNYQVTPLMAGGVLYATAGARRSVVAIDAASGETLWIYRLDEGTRGEHAPRKGPGRGVAFHRDADRETIFFITPGYQLVALDAHSGLPRSDFGEAGKVDLKLHLDQALDPETAPIGASSPPIVVGDTVIVGAAFAFSGAPVSPDALAGKVTAYDATSGELRWRFNTIPGPDEPGNDSWAQGSAGYTGNVGVWAPMSADPELGYVYLPVEAPTSDYYGGHRPGDNLYGQSLVCLNAATGERVWHFQTVHHPIWDYDLPAPPVLLDLTVEGREIPAVAQITKQGLTFVFDRRTGEPVWPIEEVAVPQTQVPEEKTAATQPFPTLPEPFGRTGVSTEQLNDLTPEILKEAQRIAGRYTLGPLYTPATLFNENNGGTLVLPGSVGGANWQGAVADPERNMLYVSYAVSPEVVGLVQDPVRSSVRYVLRDAVVEQPFDLPLLRPPWSWISAIDMNSGRIAWQRPNSDTPREVQEHPLLADKIVPATGNDDRSGLLVTKTLLFSGEGAGMYGSRWGGSIFRAHDKVTGEVLAEIDLGQNQTGVPMTYAVNGQQYIVVATGLPGEGGQLVALSLRR